MTDQDKRNDTPEITIVGAGLGGLALGAMLVRAGMRIRIYEQARQFARVGAGIGLAPNAVKAIRPLGIVDELSRLSYHPPYRTSRVWDTGEEMVRYAIAGAMEEQYGAPYLHLHRADFHGALNDLLDPGIVELGRRVASVTEDEQGVELRFEDGSQEHAEFLVAADGVHSPIREALFGASEARYTGRIAYRSVFPAELLTDHLPDPEIMHPNTKWWGPDRHIVIYYVAAGREVYFTTSNPDDSEWVRESYSAEGSLEELREAFTGFHPAVQAVLETCPKVQKWPIYVREPLPTWHTDRVVLLGDACHPMTPYMQQGGASALEDAAVLARCLAGVEADRVNDAFALYESLRLERTAMMQRGSASNTWNATMAGSSEISQESVYGYDPWAIPLDGPAVVAGGERS